MAADTPERTWVGLRDLDTAGKLATKRKETENLRYMLKRDWALNRSFYNGQQWSFWNQQMIRVENLPTDTGPVWKVRLVSNQIKPGLEHYVAQLTKTRPLITAEPDSGEDSDVKAAEMATSLFEYAFDEWGLNAKLKDVLNEAGLSGGYWKITWDALAGTPMTFTMGPDGNPIVDDELASAFLDQFAQLLDSKGMDRDAAADLAKKTVYLGDIKVEVMSAENVVLDPAVHRFEDAKWAICKHPMDPDEIEARWGKKVSPNAIKQTENPAPFTDDKRPQTLREVYIMYIRPNPALPKGRYVAWIEGPDEILQDMDWPYPFRELPLVKFPGQYRPGSPYDDPIVTDARPMQKDLNKTLSQIVEHKNLTVRPQMLAPIGSLRTKLTTEPGAVFEYNLVGGIEPKWREIPNLPPYVFEHINDLQQRLDRIFNRMPSTRDQLPARADSGSMVEGMMEAVADQLSPVILGIEDALARAGKLIAAYAQEYYDEPRLLKVRGAGGSVQVKKFQASDIAGGFTFRPQYGTGLPRSRAGKQQAIMDLLDHQLIDPRQALKHLDLADVKGVTAQIARDEDHALREHDKIRRGEPINPQAIQDAQQALQQFVQGAQQQGQQMMQQMAAQAQQSGQQADPQQLQQQVAQQMQQQYQQLQQDLQDAPWKPVPYENVETHLATHMDFMKTTEFESYDPQMQGIFIKHLNLSFALAAEQMWMRADPKNLPKVSITAKATTSAKVLSKALVAAGIQTDENEVAEKPLETAVLDFVDKADQEDTGNSQQDQMAQQLEMMQGQDAHLLSQAQTAQAMADAQATAAQAAAQKGQAQVHAQTTADVHAAATTAKTAQEMQHSQELHDLKVQHEKEMHAAQLAKAKRPPAKPASRGK